MANFSLPCAAACRFVELDRCAAAAEAGYAVGLYKVLGADTMAKNDLLVGLPCGAAAGQLMDPLASASAAQQQVSEAAGMALASDDLASCCRDCVALGLLWTQPEAW